MDGWIDGNHNNTNRHEYHEVLLTVVFDEEDDGPCVPEGRTLPRDT
jgi:hypothetical protein